MNPPLPVRRSYPCAPVPCLPRLLNVPDPSLAPGPATVVECCYRLRACYHPWVIACTGSTSFGKAPEIQRYLAMVAETSGVLPKIRFNTCVAEARWQDKEQVHVLFDWSGSAG